MTDHDSTVRYRLYEKLSQGEVTTYLGRTSAGERVMVHFLTGSPERDRAILSRLESVRAGTGGRRLEAGQVPVLVTEVLPGFETLESWLEGRGPAGAGRPSGPGPEGAGDSSGGDRRAEPSAGDRRRAREPGTESTPGEFTRMFVLGQSRVGDEEAEEVGGEVAEEAGAGETVAREPTAEPSDEPGQFTRDFLLGRESESEAEVTESPPGESASSSEVSRSRPEDGGRAAREEAAEAADEKHPKRSAPADYRDALGGEESEGGAAESGRTQHEEPPAKPESKGVSSRRGGSKPGQFTKLFGGDDTEAREPTLRGPGWKETRSDSAADDSYLERLAGLSSGASEPEAAPELAPPSGPPEPKPPTGPGQYTRIIQGPESAGDDGPAGGYDSPGGTAPRPPGTKESGAGDPASSGRPRRKRYLIALGGVVLLAIVLVVALALLAGGDGAPEANGGESPLPEAGAVEEAGVNPPGEGG